MMKYRGLPFEQVTYGLDTISDYLLEEIQRVGAQKIVFVTTNSLIATQSYRQITNICKDFPVVIQNSKQHVPIDVLVEGVEELIAFSPDLIISLGGGSAIDTAKIMSMMITEEVRTKEQLINMTASVQGKKLQLKHSPIVHFAIPTTLSAAEFTCNAGLGYDGLKSIIYHPSLTPNHVFLDPSVTLDTPIDLWASTGMKAVDHAVETIYSPIISPINETLALQAVQDLYEYLPLTKKHPDDLQYRLNCQIAAWMSLFSFINVELGLSHKIGHLLGALFHIPHGSTSAIMLPHVMGFMSENSYAVNQLAKMFDTFNQTENSDEDTIEDQIGREEKGRRAAGYIHELVQQLQIPHRLREFNVPKERLGEVVAKMTKGRKGRKSVEHSSESKADDVNQRLLQLLEQAW